MGKVLIKEVGKMYFFEVYSMNGKLIAHSKHYTTLCGCKNGIASMAKSMQNFKIEMD